MAPSAIFDASSASMGSLDLGSCSGASRSGGGLQAHPPNGSGMSDAMPAPTPALSPRSFVSDEPVDLCERVPSGIAVPLVLHAGSNPLGCVGPSNAGNHR